MRILNIIDRVESWNGWEHVKDVFSLLLILIWISQLVEGTHYYAYAQETMRSFGLVSGGFNILTLFNIVVCLAALPVVIKAVKRLLKNR